jgi:uncharacterized protein YjiS (DUF1127 family)
MNASENRQRGRADRATTVMTMLTAIARYFRARKRYDNAVHELSHLTDRELADIGISRGDIPRLAREHSIAEMATPAGADRRDHTQAVRSKRKLIAHSPLAGGPPDRQTFAGTSETLRKSSIA